MDSKHHHGLPPQLEATRLRFERWRQNRHGRSPIPDSLWNAAVKAAASYGVCRTAKVLRLSYYALKKRLQQKAPATAGPGQDTGTTFLELPPLPRTNSAECVLELEGADGTMKRVRLKGLDNPELQTLIQSFWDS